LIPAYALLAIPAAELVRGAATLGQGRWRLATAGVVAAGLAVHAGGQQIVLGHMVRTQYKARRDYGAIAGELRSLGVRAPCTLAGEQAPVLAFYAGCRSMQIAGNDASTNVPGLLAQANVTRLAVVEYTNVRPRYTHGWHHYTFTTPTGRTWRIFVPRRPPAAPRS
ncbi:hypothetical protein, partial [Actinoallomurus acaciae]